MMESILAHPELQGLRRWMLVTRDAHGLYRKVGFRELARPERIMEMAFAGIYESHREVIPLTPDPSPGGRGE